MSNLSPILSLFIKVKVKVVISMLLLLGAFLAGIVTVFAPCVLPLLPVIIGGSVSGNTTDKKRPIVIALSLAISLIVFTLLLKATTLLINIPPQAIAYVSGTIIIIIGILSLFPLVYEKAIIKLGIQSRSQELVGVGLKNKNTLVGPIIIGAALGPVFSSCSPVYAYILATVLPVNFIQALVYIISYVLGLSIMLLLIGYFGQKFIRKVKWASDPKGKFQRTVAILFIIVGILVFSGYDKRVQTYVSQHTPFDFDGLSAQLIPGANKNKPQTGKVYNVKSYPAPELTGLNEWINSKPLKLKELRGKVVLVDFWTYSCINCIRMHPYIQGWYDTYKDDNFVVLGIHAPEFAFEKVPENVKKATKEAGLTYPIALDNDFSTWNAFQNQYWPANYLIDKEGSVRRVHYGEGEYKEMEQAIRGLLQEKGGTVPNKMFVSGSGNDKQNEKLTPETYLGTKRASSFKGETRLLAGQTQDFVPSSNITDDHWTLQGKWHVESENITAAGGQSELTIKTNAKEVYVVAQSEKEQEISVGLDGKPISSTHSAGKDIKNSKLKVKNPQLYRVVSNPQFKGGSLTLTVPDGVSLNVFTFGG